MLYEANSIGKSQSPTVWFFSQAMEEWLEEWYLVPIESLDGLGYI